MVPVVQGDLAGAGVDSEANSRIQRLMYSPLYPRAITKSLKP